MLKQDNKEKNSGDLLDDFLERGELSIDDTPDSDNSDNTDTIDIDTEDTATLAVTALDDDAASQVDDATAQEDEEEAPIDILDQRVFHMSRYQFWGTAGGFGIGYIVSGALSALGLNWADSGMIMGVACAAGGWLLMGRLHKKKVAQRDAQRDAQQNDAVS